MKFVGESSPAWTQSQARRVGLREPDSQRLPPGLYDADKYERYLNSRKKGLLRSGPKRCPINLNDTPGVGEYEMTKYSSTKYKELSKPFASSDDRFKSPNNSKPGPGTYRLSGIGDESLSHGYMGYSEEPKRLSNSVGPTSYNPKFSYIWNNTKGTIMKPLSKKLKIAEFDRVRERLRFQKENEEIKRKLRRNRHTIRGTFSIGSSNISGVLNSSIEGPGPGSYFLEVEENHNEKGISLCGKPKPIKTDQELTPGPGSYSVTTKNTSKGVTKYGSGLRLDSLKPNTISPGPAAYSIPDTILHPKSNAVAFKHAARLPSSSSLGPGPSKYNTREIMVQPPLKITIKQRLPLLGKKESVNGSPGPGHYSPAVAGISGTPKIKKPYFSKTNKSRLPGPGSYSISRDLGQEAGFKYQKPLSESISEMLHEVGPGSYNIESTVPQLQYWVKRKLQHLGVI